MNSVKEIGSFIQSPESKIDKLGLTITLKNITSNGATMIFELKEKGTSNGLQYGDDFAVQVEKNGVWENVPTILKGDIGFDAIAHIIPSEQNIKWDWIYGSLSPGIYRISKNILDVRLNSGPVNYQVFAHFKIN